MKNETRIVKNLLLHYFPQEKIGVRFVEAKQYYTTSDKIIVTVPQSICDDVVRILRKNTIDIKITKKGNAASISGITKPQIYNVVNNQYWDAGLVEFIEVETF